MESQFLVELWVTGIPRRELTSVKLIRLGSVARHPDWDTGANKYVNPEKHIRSLSLTSQSLADEIERRLGLPECNTQKFFVLAGNTVGGKYITLGKHCPYGTYVTLIMEQNGSVTEVPGNPFDIVPSDDSGISTETYSVIWTVWLVSPDKVKLRVSVSTIYDSSNHDRSVSYVEIKYICGSLPPGQQEHIMEAFERYLGLGGFPISVNPLSRFGELLPKCFHLPKCTELKCKTQVQGIPPGTWEAPSGGLCVQVPAESKPPNPDAKELVLKSGAYLVVPSLVQLQELLPQGRPSLSFSPSVQFQELLPQGRPSLSLSPSVQFQELLLQGRPSLSFSPSVQFQELLPQGRP
ncbi:MAG: hypothetical protein LBD43_01200, partial [Holosporales bacterium]|nr:hypothetical protein [Holosporales bacterium]